MLDCQIDVNMKMYNAKEFQFNKDEFDDNFFNCSIDEINMESEEEKEKIVLNEDEMINPFFVSIHGGPLVKMDMKEINARFKRILILCRKNNSERIDLTDFFCQTITREKYQKIGKYLTLLIGNLKMLKNYLHKKQALIIHYHLLLIFNNNKIKLENEEIVIPMLELNEDDVIIYMKLYNNNKDLSNFIKTKILCQYYNCQTQKYPFSNKISQLTYNLKEADHWLNPYNCKINMTQVFIKRTFNYKNVNGDVIFKAEETNKFDPNIRAIIDSFFKPKDKDYNDISPDPFYKKETYTDLSLVAKRNGFKLYKIDYEEPKLTKEQVIELFKMTKEEKELYDMFNTFLLSKTYCHLVINNKDILKIMNPIINKYILIYKYIWTYAWLCMYMEECITKTNTKENCRYVFDIDTANNLPFFPFCHFDIYQNPYLPVLVSEEVLKSNINCHGLAMIKGFNDYGIDNLSGFKKKFNIFTTNRIDKNIFDGVETIEGTDRWKNFAISGSIITACCEKNNPLIDIITQPTQSYTEKWARFFNEYYYDSDIDVMCNKSSIFDYMDEVQKLIDIIKKNLNEINNKNISDTVEVESIKSLVVIVHVNYLTECMPEYTVDKIINNIDSNEIKELFYSIYVTSKTNQNKKYRLQLGPKNNPLYEHFFKLEKIDNMNIIITKCEITKEFNKEHINEHSNDYCIYLNDIRPQDRQVSNDKNILLLKISESIKFKIKSTYMLHSVEVFKIKYPEFFSTVSRFHLPCVRGYYTGDNVYLLPSCISALMTYTNIDYKYFTGLRNPIEIINKYRIRGFGILLNDKEKAHVIEYNCSVPKWQNIFSLNLKDKQSLTNHMGPRKLGDNMFKLMKYLQSFPEDVYRNVDYQYILTIEDLYDYYKMVCNYDPKNCGIDFIKFKAINNNGYLEPVKIWLIEAAYDLLSKKS